MRVSERVRVRIVFELAEGADRGMAVARVLRRVADSAELEGVRNAFVVVGEDGGEIGMGAVVREVEGVKGDLVV